VRQDNKAVALRWLIQDLKQVRFAAAYRAQRQILQRPNVGMSSNNSKVYQTWNNSTAGRDFNVSDCGGPFSDLNSLLVTNFELDDLLTLRRTQRNHPRYR